MGVRGLTTFIANRSSRYLEPYELHDTYLVVDADSISCSLYKWHSKCNDCFGGDYDKFAHHIRKFFATLASCKITPLLVWDGGYEHRKLKTINKRMKNRIQLAHRLTASDRSESCFPLFIREVVLDVAAETGVRSVRCDFEGDSEAAHLARSLRCPLVSYDSDFYIYDVLYIPFSTFDLTAKRRQTHTFISCELYRVDKFLAHYNLGKESLALLAVLLGNDYIERNYFSHFFRHVKVARTRTSGTQRTIEAMVQWLGSYAEPRAALRAILGRFKLARRRTVARRIKSVLKVYQSGDSQVLAHFGLEPTPVEAFEVPDPDEIDEIDASEASEGSEASEEEAVELIGKKLPVPAYFLQNYRRCCHPSGFVDMMHLHLYFCTPILESRDFEHAHTVSLRMLAAMHQILNNPTERQLGCVAGNRQEQVAKSWVQRPEMALPSLGDIEAMDGASRKSVLLGVLGLDSALLDEFPASWSLFLIGVRYWARNSSSKVDVSMVYSLLLCAIVLNFVDAKVGYNRGVNSIQFKCRHLLSAVRGKPELKTSICEAFEAIDREDAVFCQAKLVHYFEIDSKMRANHRLYDRWMVHAFSELQSCLYHINFLNGLLLWPFERFIVSNFYNGTFVYNMAVNLRKRTDPKLYLPVLLENSPLVLNCLLLVGGKVNVDLGECALKGGRKKRRKNTKRGREVAEENDGCMDLEDESSGNEYEDENNVFALLSIVQ